MSVESLFLEVSAAKLQEYLSRIEICLGKLDETQIWTRSRNNENAIGNLALHLAGNVRQWIISSLGNTADHRDRHGEFEARGGIPAAQLAARLRQAVEEATQIISSLTTAQLIGSYVIQDYPVSGVEVVYHVVEHFSQHTGQIIFATKMLSGDDLGFYRHLNRQ
jgi:uncharacterized damage-inducible protein DinB